jgi:hypothetical protein
MDQGEFVKAVMAVVGLMFPFAVEAACVCRCVNGKARAICSSASDIEPNCASMMCSRTQPSVDEVRRPKVPPVGTSVCRQVQVYNERTRGYEWVELCDDGLSADVRAKR